MNRFILLFVAVLLLSGCCAFSSIKDPCDHAMFHAVKDRIPTEEDMSHRFIEEGNMEASLIEIYDEPSYRCERARGQFHDNFYLTDSSGYYRTCKRRY